MTGTVERQVLIDAMGLALAFMYRAEPALAGRYLDRLVEVGHISAEDALYLMDGLKEHHTAEGDA